MGDPRVLAFDDYELDFSRAELRRAGRPVDIQPTPLRVLLHLAEHRDRTVSRRELLDAVWPDVVVGDDALTTALKEARHAVGDTGAVQRTIGTQKGRGYRFLAQVLEPESATRTETARPPRPRQLVSISAAALVLVAAGAALIASRVRVPEPLPLTPIVAVTPFANLSGDADAQVRADGLTEELISALSGPDSVVRVARAASSDARAVGRALGACCVLTGGVRVSGSHTRVTAQLVSVEDGTQLWSGVLDRAMGDPLREAEAIASQIAWRLRAWTYEQSVASAAKSPEVARLLREMIAASAQGKRTEVVAAAERALALDPSQWIAHSYAALQLAEMVDEGGDPYAEVAPRVGRHIKAALRLAPHEATVYRAASRVHLFNWDWEGALREGRIACELTPDDFFACAPLVQALLSTGRIEEALRIQRHTSAKLPTFPGASAFLAAVLGTAGRAAEAEQECVRANELADGTIEYCANTFWAVGRRADAVEVMRRGYEANGLLTIALEIARLRDSGGPEAVWRGVAESQAPEDRLNSAFCDRAELFAQLGDVPAALTALERSLTRHEGYLAWFLVTPTFDVMRDEPRFKAIVEQMGLTAYHAIYLKRPRVAPSELVQ